MAATIFSRIIAGEVPCHRVYEDEHVFAFLDAGPLSRGHTLVLPKEAAERLEQLSDTAAAAIGRALPRICRAIVKATGAIGYNVLLNNGPAAGQLVMHVHFHIIPKHPDGSGLGLIWRPRAREEAEGAELARRINAHVEAE